MGKSSMNEFKTLAALFSALLGAWAIGAFANALVPYALAISCIWFAFLWWRKRGTPNDFAVRFGVACLALALLAIFLRSVAFGGHAAA
ncbi:hypothetical protein [Thermomonas paludicola]|jgi:hypothetical protein|uniref:hypothetical protein n=1 Tax=Thermomonas paludicola TaxID=2884874 RepID=UPI0021151071|nr:hypothetical protein [Thermomonas paludicola]